MMLDVVRLHVIDDLEEFERGNDGLQLILVPTYLQSEELVVLYELGLDIFCKFEWI